MIQFCPTKKTEGKKLGKARVAGPDRFRTLVERYLRSLHKLPPLISGFFADHNLAYIAQARERTSPFPRTG